MKKVDFVLVPILCLFIPSLVLAIEVAPRITDREIIESLTRLQEGQNTLRVEIKANAEAIKQLRADMNAQFGRIDTQFGRINAQFGRIDAQFGRIDTQFSRIDAQFDRLVNLMLGMMGVFVVLVATTIGFALWDRRTMVRPFETKVKEIEEDISQNRQRLHSLLEALRALSQTDEKVAQVLRNFHLL